MNEVSPLKRSPRVARVAHLSGRREGVALVLILGFLVLLTGLTLAFFSRAMIERQVSNSSAAQTKADLIATSAADVIVGNLKQEIVLGSTAVAVSPTPSSGTAPATIYTPNSNFYMVPLRFGTPAPTGNPATPIIPNLVRYSMHGDTTGTPTPAPNASPNPNQVPFVPSLASNVNSTNNPSANGRTVGLARWNSHYLIPRLNLSSTSIDSTPVASFTPPDWVMVTSSGPKVLTQPDPKTVGRYAYAIYDEGGLLDVNVAGYPMASPAPSGTPYPTYKGVLSYADLTQLPTTAGVNLTYKDVNSIVGWRNYVTAQVSGSLGSYTFQTSGPSNSFLLYDQYVRGVSTGFLSANPAPAATASRSDQIFTSRQALLRFRRSSNGPGKVGFSQNALQYLGTFSRDLEQPSFIPNAGRSKVQNNTTTDGSLFGVGNDASGTDRTGTPSTDINPPFLSVRAGATLTRNDGTTGQVGDPLMLKRFPLNRLSLILSSKTATKNQSDPIYKNFGLYRTSTSGPWLYDHGNSTGIYRLDQMKALGREPDFFELLKAAINIGSVGKASCYNSNNSALNWNNSTNGPSPGFLQNARDTQSQLQILQIGANIIDQSKADNFPTRIQFGGSSNYEVRGDEDLPYLYRLRNWPMRTGAMTGAMLLQPELWNPHSQGSSAYVPSGSSPSNFRVRIDRDATASTSPVSFSVVYTVDQKTYVPVASVNLNSGNTLPTPVTFSLAAGDVTSFREPTLLAKVGTPTAINLSGTGYTDYPPYTPDPNRSVTGLTVATFNWTNATSTDVATKIAENNTGVNSCLHLYLEYQDLSGNWITYDEQQTAFDGEEQITKPATNIQNVALNPYGGRGRTDPRTSRWGMHITQYINLIPEIGAANSNIFSTYRPTSGISYGDHIGGRKDLGFNGTANSYTGGTLYGYRGFQHGYWTENSTRPTYQTDGDSGFRFNVDPDGIPRRAMGGYNSDTANGGTLTKSAAGSSSGSDVYGLPMVTGNYASRPTILHRPFRSVGELGYVFRGTPWGNLDMAFPESGDTALLDVFCVNENIDPSGLVAGRVNLNTSQAPVIQAIIENTLLDKDDSSNPTLSSAMASIIASQLVARTTNMNVTATSNTTAVSGPLTNRAQLVGDFTYASNLPTVTQSALTNDLTSNTMDPNKYYSGFSADIGTPTNVQKTTVALIPRQRESAIRALADVGTTRVWNLMIDLVAQSGRYPTNATQLSNFVVDGEKRYWLHIAIDRYTGKVLDRQLELVEND